MVSKQLWVYVYLVGNKDDNVERKVVQSVDARRLADQIGIPFIETSAKENKNVEEVGHGDSLLHYYSLQYVEGISGKNFRIWWGNVAVDFCGK